LCGSFGRNDNTEAKPVERADTSRNVATALDTVFNSRGALPPGFAAVFGLSGAWSALYGAPASHSRVS
jgi:hypothetical protein